VTTKLLDTTSVPTEGAQNGVKMVHVFVTGTINSHFIATGQIGMKFREKRQSVSSIEP